MLHASAAALPPHTLLPGVQSRFDTLHQGLYLGFSGLRSIDSPQLYSLWHDDSLNATMFLDATDASAATLQPASLFSLGAMYSAAAQEVHFAALDPSSSGPLAANRNWRFLQVNGPGTLYKPLVTSLDIMVRGRGVFPGQRSQNCGAKAGCKRKRG